MEGGGPPGKKAKTGQAVAFGSEGTRGDHEESRQRQALPQREQDSEVHEEGEESEKRNATAEEMASRSHSQSRSSPSASATADGGFNESDNHLRSVIHHPAGLPLVCFFNNNHQPCACVEEFVASVELATKINQEKTSRRYNEILSTSYRAFERYVRARKSEGKPPLSEEKKETLLRLLPYGLNRDQRKKLSQGEFNPPMPNEEQLTRTLYEKIREALGDIGDGGRVEAAHQVPVTSNASRSTRPCVTDLLMRCKAMVDGKQNLVLLMEVGINTDWWQKIHQNIKYAKGFLEEAGQNDGTVFRAPMLFAVLTVRTEDGYDKPAFQSAQLGVFLCTRAKRPPLSEGGDSFRMALLWRRECEALQEASEGLGKTIRGACLLPDLLYEVTSEGYDFEYLGPNCCRRGDRVYRAYDTRFRYTHRRPDLYAKFAPPKDGCADPDVVAVCRVSNGEDNACEDAPRIGAGAVDLALRDSRSRMTDLLTRMNWIWSPQGELLVIKVPFIKGNHFATHPTDFVKVIAFLQTMHDKGYVHGDIRGFNMIVREGLIDFDYGGLIKAGRTYPPGYRSELSDGYRLGEQGQTITTWHDWYALIKVMFRFHDFKPPEVSASHPDRRFELLDEKDALQRRQEAFLSLVAQYEAERPEPNPQVQKDLPVKLIEFLRDAENAHWQVVLDAGFKKSLRKFGYLKPEQAGGHSATVGTPRPMREATGPGTPSPPNRAPLF